MGAGAAGTVVGGVVTTGGVGLGLADGPAAAVGVGVGVGPAPTAEVSWAVGGVLPVVTAAGELPPVAATAAVGATVDGVD
jgi:hypothetical protein